jgi:hypothetical protein
VVSRVFVDFGRNRVYALPEDGDEVVVFNDFLEMFEKLRPTIVVADSYPRKLQPTITRLDGATFLRLRDLKKLSEERNNNGLRKTDENDVKALRQIFYEAPDLFQPLYASPVELEVRALTELWVELVGIKKAAKYTRTTTNDPLAVETHRTLQRYAERLATRIHERAMELPLYSMAVERLGLKGPSLAYIVSHDSIVLKTLSRTGLETRYELFRRPWRGRGLRSQLLIQLAYATVTHRNQRYLAVYESYRQRGKKRWQAILRVAQRILRDIRRLAVEAQEAGPNSSLTEKKPKGWRASIEIQLPHRCEKFYGVVWPERVSIQAFWVSLMSGWRKTNPSPLSLPLLHILSGFYNFRSSAFSSIPRVSILAGALESKG